MALSNWDTLAFDKDGKPANGVFQSGNITVELYKNWLYVHDKKAWEKGGGFTDDTVMQVIEGDIVYKSLHIVAERGRQNSVLCVVWTSDYSKKGRDIYNVMIGCGVYGYRGSKWVGVEQKTFDQLIRFAKKVIGEELIGGEDMVTYPGSPLRFNQGDGFFAKAGVGDITATEVGQAEEPIFIKLMTGDSK